MLRLLVVWLIVQLSCGTAMANDAHRAALDELSRDVRNAQRAVGNETGKHWRVLSSRWSLISDAMGDAGDPDLTQRLADLRRALPLPFAPANESVSEAAKGSSARLRGRVTDGITGLGISFLTVTAWYESKDGWVAHASTGPDALGNFELSVQPERQYVVVAADFDRYLTTVFPDEICPSVETESCPFEAGARFFLGVDATVDIGVFSVPRGGVITGRVLDTNGAPMADARVEIITPHGEWRAGANVDTAGRYRVDALYPGDYLARSVPLFDERQLFDRVPCTDFQNCTPEQLGRATVIETRNNEVVVDIDFVHPAQAVRASFEGYILSSGGGSPVAGCIELYGPDGFYFERFCTNSDGRFRFDSLQVGQYFVVVEAPGYVRTLHDGIPCPIYDCDVINGEPVTLTTNGLVMDFEVAPLPTISGVVWTTGSAPLENADVTAYRVEGLSSVDEYYSSSGADGAYRVAVEPGEYLVVASKPRYGAQGYDGIACGPREFSPPDCPLGQVTFVSVDSNTSATDIDFVLTRFASISGRLVPEVDGFQSFFNMRVHATNGAETYVQDISSDSYEISNLPAGRYRLYLTGDDVFAVAYPDTACGNGPQPACSEAGAPIEVAEGEDVARIDFVVRSRFQVSALVVSRETGTPLSGVAVDAWSPLDPEPIATAVTGDDGRYGLLVRNFYGDGSAIYLTTDNILGFRDQVYDDVQCESGSVFEGLCDLDGGTPLRPPFDSLQEGNVSFALDFVDRVFGDGFE